MTDFNEQLDSKTAPGPADGMGKSFPEDSTAKAAETAVEVAKASEDLEVVTPLNTAYVAPEAKPDSEFDLNRDGGLEGGRRTVSQGFMVSTHLDPRRQADPHGVYLDDVQRRKAEVVRAKVEGREPDLDNPGSTVGQVVYQTHVAEKYAQPGTKVVSEFTLDVVVGDYERDSNGNAIVPEGNENE